MYNVYAFEKQEKEKELKKVEDERIRKQKAKHEEKMNLLNSKYEKRLKNFIYSMAKYPQKINDYKEPEMNPRADYLKKQHNDYVTKEGGNSGKNNSFIFNVYQTDIERIDSRIRRGSIKGNLIKKSSLNNKRESIELNSIINSLNAANTGNGTGNMQLNLKLLAQTNYDKKKDPKRERVMSLTTEDSFESNSFQFSYLHDENYNHENAGGTMRNTLTSLKFPTTTTTTTTCFNTTRSKNKPKSLLFDGNSVKRTLLAEKHLKEKAVKTHFKGVQEYTQTFHDYYEDTFMKKFLKKVDFNKKEKEKEKEKIIKLKNAGYSSRVRKNNPLKLESEDLETTAKNYNENIKHFITDVAEDNNDRLTIIRSNPGFVYNSEPQKDYEVDRNKLSYLKSLAYAGTAETVVLKKKHNYLNKLRLKNITTIVEKEDKNPLKIFIPKKTAVHKDDLINLDGEVFTKDQIDKLGKKILQKCNFSHEKNIHNRERLKSGNGKMMITNGLTIAEFTKKFNL